MADAKLRNWVACWSRCALSSSATMPENATVRALPLLGSSNRTGRPFICSTLSATANLPICEVHVTPPQCGNFASSQSAKDGKQCRDEHRGSAHYIQQFRCLADAVGIHPFAFHFPGIDCVERVAGSRVATAWLGSSPVLGWDAYSKPVAPKVLRRRFSCH